MALMRLDHKLKLRNKYKLVFSELEFCTTSLRFSKVKTHIFKPKKADEFEKNRWYEFTFNEDGTITIDRLDLKSY